MLRNKSSRELFAMLKKLDPRRAANIDSQNAARLVRAIEIVKSTGKPVPIFSSLASQSSTLILGIKKDQNELYKLIDKRVIERFKAGLIDETKKLIKSGVREKRLAEIGLTYRIVAWGIKNKIGQQEILERVQLAERKFSKRQMTWFKRDSRIKWISTDKQAEKLIKSYIKKTA